MWGCVLILYYMKSTLATLFIIFGFILTQSCTKKEDPEPDKVSACFSANKSKAYPNEAISFSNCSTGAVSYQWDFGDGTTSTETNPTKTYTTTGTYTVKLSSYTSTPATGNSSITTTIQIGQRYLTKVRIENLPTTNTLGNPWDTGSAADLKFYFGKASNTTGYDYITTEQTDATLPCEWDFTSQNIVLTNENWKFKISDVDGSSEEEIGNTPSFNPTTMGSNGAITFTSSNSTIKLLYDFK